LLVDELNKRDLLGQTYFGRVWLRLQLHHWLRFWLGHGFWLRHVLWLSIHGWLGSSFRGRRRRLRWRWGSRRLDGYVDRTIDGLIC
jgi:hypothetical protein